MEISKEKIAQYLAGDSLPAKEIVAIEKMLAEDSGQASNIFEEFGENSFDSETLKGLEIVGAEHSKSKIQSIHGDLKKEGFFEKKGQKSGEDESETKVRSMFSGRLLQIAASIAILIGVGFFALQNFGGSTSPGQLAADFKNDFSGDDFSVVDNLRSEPGEVDPMIKNWTEVETFFNSKNYPAAIEKMKSFDEKTITDYPSNYYFQLGVLEWKNGDSDAALASFDKLKNTVRSKDADFYRALIFVEKGDFAKAKPLLNSLSGKPGKYEEKAKEIFESL